MKNKEVQAVKALGASLKGAREGKGKQMGYK